PGDRAGDVAACTSELARVVRMLAQPCARARDVLDRRRDDETRLQVAHDVERTAGIRRRDYRLLREEGLVRHESVVLVHGRVVDTEAARVQIGELAVVDAPGEGRAPVEAALARDPLEPLAVGPVA